jgi:hypothetical protein
VVSSWLDDRILAIVLLFTAYPIIDFLTHSRFRTVIAGNININRIGQFADLYVPMTMLSPSLNAVLHSPIPSLIDEDAPQSEPTCVI